MTATLVMGFDIEQMRKIASRLHRLLRFAVGHANRFEVGDLAVPCDQADAAGDTPVIDISLDDVCNPVESFGGEAHIFGGSRNLLAAAVRRRAAGPAWKGVGVWDCRWPTWEIDNTRIAIPKASFFVMGALELSTTSNERRKLRA